MSGRGLNWCTVSRAFRTERYFGSLDGLRTLSIVPVVWHHSTPHIYAGALGRGPVGVDLFFAISGFLITTLLVRERAVRGHVDLGAFYLRRSLRIFPLYYTVLALHVAYAAWVRPHWAPCQEFLQRWPYFASYTANWFETKTSAGPVLFAFAWSLCTEEQFYAFWAPVLRWARSLWLAAVVMSSALLLDLIVERGLLTLGLSSTGVRILTSFATPIGFGALLALALTHPTLERCLLYWLARPYSAPIVAVLVVSLIVKPWAPVTALHLLLAVLVVCCAVRRDNGLARLLDNAVMRWGGKVSYGVYLLHVPVIGAMRTLLPQLRGQAFVVFALALPMSIALASVSFVVVEQPLTRWGKRIAPACRE
jgi:peptidoglycan/LPS O-acetylase OafA/YrhL